MARTEGVLNNSEILSVEELDQINNNSLILKNNTGSYSAISLGVQGSVPVSNGTTSAPTFQLLPGTGDMLKATYDPLNKNGDAFDMDNMVEGTTNKILTSTERTDIASNKTHTTNTSNPHSVTKTQVGLANVDNTSDLSKPISTATQTALNGKQIAGTYASGTGSASGVNTGDVTLAGIPNYITIVGQVITRTLINLTSHITGILGIANGGTGSSTASGARTALGVEASLGNPTNDGDILSSTIAGVRSWITPASGGGTGVTIFDGNVAGPLYVGDIFEILTPSAFTLSKFNIQTSTLPVGANITVTVKKNGTTVGTTTITTTNALTNGLYLGTLALTTAFVANDRVTISVATVGTTIPGSNLSWSLS